MYHTASDPYLNLWFKKKHREGNHNSVCSHPTPTPGLDFMYEAGLKFIFELLTSPLCILSPTFYYLTIFSLSLHILSLQLSKKQICSHLKFITSSLRTKNISYMSAYSAQCLCHAVSVQQISFDFFIYC